MSENAAEASPTPDVKTHTLREMAVALGPILRPHRTRLIFACLSVAIAGGAYGLMPLFSKYLLDVALLEHRSLTLAAWIAGAFLLAQCLRQTCWYLAMRQFLFLQERVTFALRTRGFGHVQRLCLRFHSKYPTGFLYQRVFGSAIASVGGAMQSVFKNLALYITGIITSVTCCLMLSVPMTGVVLVGVLGYVLVGRSISKRIYQKARVSQEAQNLITEFIMDRLRGAKTVQAMTIEDDVQQDFESRLWPAQLKNLAVAKENFRLSLATETLGYALTSAIWVVGAYSVLDLDLTLGDLVAFMGYQATFTTLVSVLTGIWGEIANARAGFDQLLTVLETQSTVPSLPETAESLHFAPVRGDLELRNISFRYGDGPPVIRDFSVQVPHGQSVALVGRSGSGKTTLASLLMRFYDPDQGAILLDGQNIREIPIRAYRQHFGIVLQDPYLFDESVRVNLRYADPDATDEQIIDALRAAQAWSFVDQLPGKLDYRVGESGGQLSGGQKQRLAIARCLLLRSKFVVLDEPTSALDVESEQAIQQAFDRLFENRTVFIIAHRLSTIRRADRILVIDEGRIVQDGRYADLIEQSGLFRQFHEIAMDPTNALSARLRQG
ncbi:MAG: ABC transporter ATP-binding protein [Phycisphaeraceae bacterium]|nr:ABC transporter ATP-binding protein [Phycisphaeraceae bacterium]